MPSTKSLSAKVRKLELDARARGKPLQTRYVFVESEADLRKKRMQEEPGCKYMYFHWVWGEKEVEM